MLNADQLSALQKLFHEGSIEASRALALWIAKSSVIEIDAFEQIPLEEATSLLAAGDEPICFCATDMHGLLSGKMILAFDDASGFALAEMLLEQQFDEGEGWTDISTSAALETTNILCCAYLNALSNHLSKPGEPIEILPSPPQFRRDFAESLLEFALMEQAMVGDNVILARTKFEIDGTPVHWTLLFVPDAEPMSRLSKRLKDSE